MQVDDNPPDDQIISGAEALADQNELAHGEAEPGDLSIGLSSEQPAEQPGEQNFLTPTEESALVGVESAGELESPSGDAPADPADSGTDAGLSVDELLGEAVLEEGALDPSLSLAAGAPPAPTFQLHLRGLTEAQRPAFRKLLEAQGLQLPDKGAGTPVLSQLTEFQAVLALQAARALGIATDGSVQLPEAMPSEDELALGDLSAVPDTGGVSTESAPSVALPKGEKDVMLCSPTQIPGIRVVESLGIVLAHRSIARRLFREEDLRDKLDRELKAVPGRPTAALPSSHLQQVLRELLLELRKAGLAKGGNSVLGVKLEAFPESSSLDPQLEQLRLVAFGTAALVEKT